MSISKLEGIYRVFKEERVFPQTLERLPSRSCCYTPDELRSCATDWENTAATLIALIAGCCRKKNSFCFCYECFERRRQNGASVPAARSLLRSVRAGRSRVPSSKIKQQSSSESIPAEFSAAAAEVVSMVAAPDSNHG